MADTTPLHSPTTPASRVSTQALTPSTSIRTQLGPLLAFLGVFAAGTYAVARLEGRIDAIQLARQDESRALEELRSEVRGLHDALVYSHVLAPGNTSARTLPSAVAP